MRGGVHASGSTLKAVAESRPLVGSSKYMIEGLVTASIPRLNLRFSPPARPNFNISL